MSESSDVLNQDAKGQLRSIIERVERLEEEKAELAGLIKEVFGEAKGNGFDVKIIRKVIRIRRMDRAKRQEEEALTDLYLAALGELPLFEDRTAVAPSSTADAVRVSITGPDGVERPLGTLGDIKAVSAALGKSRPARRPEPPEPDSEPYRGGEARKRRNARR